MNILLKILPRRKVSEEIAAAEFVFSMVIQTEKHWGDICKSISHLNPDYIKLSKNQQAIHEFAMAKIAIQMQALPNVIEKTQAFSIKSKISKTLTKLNPSLLNRVECYEKALTSNSDFMIGVEQLCIEIHNRMATPCLTTSGFISPLYITTITLALIKADGGYWKNYAARHKIFA